MTRARKILLFMALMMFWTFTAISLCFASPQEYTYIDLVNMLTDMERLATLPHPGESCRQWSSYDRRSYYDPQIDKYVDWDANGDGDGYGGLEAKTINGRRIMAEINGPGVIWRIWSATAKQGRVSIYLDGAKTPAVDMPFENYFNGEHEPFTRESLVHIAAQGKNCYVPISFSKSCLILADKDYGRYFEFVYTTFPEGTKVEPFTRDLTPQQNAALDRADSILSNCRADMFTHYPSLDGHAYEGVLAPGAATPIASLTGAGAIASLNVNLDLPDDEQARRDILRELVLQINWDGSPEPAVWTPLGDFFGTAPGVNLYNSLPLGMTEDGFYSNWFMPFSRSADVAIINGGAQARKIEVEIARVPLSQPIENYGRFHAKWHRDAFLPTEPERWIDWTILTTQGRGRYCGAVLNVWNPRGGWWGEGDEKFHIDGEKFPSTFGTGSEDYFGYAWCDWTLFTNCYHNQTISNYNKGHISVNRWHITDNVPFQKSFDGYIEKYYANDRPTQYSAVTYWYLDPAGRDLYEPVTLADRRDYYTQLTFPLEMAGITVLESPPGAVDEQGMGAFKQDKWKDDAQLWWIAEQPGRELRLLVRVEKKGKYALRTRFTKASDYGIVELALDGKKIGDRYDLYHPDGVVATGPIKLGPVELAAGDHVLSVKMVGMNPDARGPYMFGMDYLRIVKTR